MNRLGRNRGGVIGSLALAAMAASVGSASVEAQDEAAGYVARIEAAQSPNRQGYDGYTLAELMARFRIPGVSIAVIRDFKVHWAKGYGVADVETSRAVDPTTAFQAASISKPVMAMAAVRLAQEGRLSLDQDVNELLTSWRVPVSELHARQAVTPRSLLSHTSGSDDGFGFPGYKPDAPRPTVVQILNGEAPSNVGPVRFARRPFEGQKYSGGGSQIMQLILTDLTKRPFAELMEEKVLRPLGMTGSSYAQPPVGPVAERTARAHDGRGQSMGAKWHVYPEQAAAGLWTTPSDLAAVAIELQTAIRGPTGKVLSQASAREMIAPTGLGPFAVGFVIEKRGEGWYFNHGGANWGFRCNLLAHVRKGYGVVVMTNGDNGGQIIREIEERVAAAYGWDSLDKPIPR
ncbi:MAG: beta-lactamase family protein [Gemmatimonadetes bacterium]|nr:beta-lactamase family protein [Gemmatimonadota bacterium]